MAVRSPKVEDVYEEVPSPIGLNRNLTGGTHRANTNTFRNAKRTLVLCDKDDGYKAYAVVRDLQRAYAQSSWKITLVCNTDPLGEKLLKCLIGDPIIIEHVVYLVVGMDGSEILSIGAAYQMYKKRQLVQQELKDRKQREESYRATACNRSMKNNCLLCNQSMGSSYGSVHSSCEASSEGDQEYRAFVREVRSRRIKLPGIF